MGRQRTLEQDLIRCEFIIFMVETLALISAFSWHEQNYIYSREHKGK